MSNPNKTAGSKEVRFTQVSLYHKTFENEFQTPKSSN